MRQRDQGGIGLGTDTSPGKEGKAGPDSRNDPLVLDAGTSLGTSKTANPPSHEQGGGTEPPVNPTVQPSKTWLVSEKTTAIIGVSPPFRR